MSDARHTSVDVVERRIAALPCWTSDVTIEPLDGGITNHNYRVRCEHASYVVRLGEDIPVHQILRFNEIAAGKAAFAAGVSPKIQYHEHGVLVMDYIDGTTLDVEHVRDQQRLSRIIDTLRTCHTTVPLHLRGASVVFWVFHVVRDYAATLRDMESPHVSLLPDLLQMADTLERAAGPFDIVFGHNDLLPANLLDTGDRIWLIDWEYAGFNTPLFDLGGLASNSEMPEPMEQWMLEQYFNKPLEDDLWYRYQAMKCASLLRETLWSMVSELHSDIDFNYQAYTAENLNRLNESLDNFNHF